MSEQRDYALNNDSALASPCFPSFTMLNIYSFIHAPVALFGHAGVRSIRLIVLSIAGFRMAVEGLVVSIKILEILLSMVSTLPLLRLTPSTRISLPPLPGTGFHLGISSSQSISNEFVLQLIQTPPADPTLSVASTTPLETVPIEAGTTHPSASTSSSSTTVMLGDVTRTLNQMGLANSTSEWPGCKITLWSESIFNTPSANE
jgi:hypothetical protein